MGTADHGGVQDVPNEVFLRFLEALAAANASPAMIARLSAALFANKTLTEKSLKEAVLGEEPLP